MIDLLDWVSSHDLEQRDPNSNKRAAQKLYAEQHPYDPTLYAAPLEGQQKMWGIWRSEKQLFTQGDTPHEAWLAALRKIRGSRSEAPAGSGPMVQPFKQLGTGRSGDL